MVYEVHATTQIGGESIFEFSQDEPLKPGDFINPGSMVYQALRVLPDDSDRYDGIVEAQWVAGPAQAGYVGDA